MSSTEQFFRQHLMEAARQVKRDGHPFPMGFEPKLASYFVERPRRPLQRSDFEISDEALTGACPEWTPGAAQLAPHLTALAQELRLVEEQDGEVSPFLYIMF